MNKRFRIVAAGLALAALPAAADDITEAVARAVEDGTLNLSFRYRYEFVDEDGFSEDAHASTLRSRLTFAPRLNENWGFLLEFDDVRHIGNDTFNDSRNGKSDRPGVTDPEGTDLNQALVRYSGLANTDLTLGRQRINRGTQRYVGGVGWRQNEQTYDSLSAAYGDTGPLQAFYSYVYQVNRIFGPDTGTPPRELDSNSHLLDVRYGFSEALGLSSYGYFLDLEDADPLSCWTAGLRVDGALAIAAGLKLGYVAEYAYQEDYGDNPASYDADYTLFEARLSWNGVSLSAGLETLGGADSAGGGFRTPLATLHKFQGWADRFAGATGSGLASGVEDLYLAAVASALGGKFTVVYHDFDAETGGGSLGTEWDASAEWTIAERYGLLLKLARYDADGFSEDVTKAWAQFTASF